MSTPTHSALQQSRTSIERRLSDLSTHQIPRLRSCDSVAELQAAEREGNASVREARELVQEMRLDCDELEGSEAQEWRERIGEIMAQLDRSQAEWRRALLMARQVISRSHTASARRELGLDSNSQYNANSSSAQTQAQGDDKLATASQSVTDALQRTVQLMSFELQKSSYSSALLDESSNSLLTLQSSYTSFGDILRNSKGLIQSMERQDLLDALLLLLAALFFAGCVAYIVKVRVWDRGVGLLSFVWRVVTLGRSGGAAAGKLKEAAKEKASRLALQSSASSASRSSKEALIAAAAASSTTAINKAAQALQAASTTHAVDDPIGHQHADTTHSHNSDHTPREVIHEEL
ncbi:Sec20-domain-containing protein [Ceraceosorus guamensis]|uniref:Sec20-domain-containing protein n=1 Tax=Ceraceosorus guamensis TaxID=1522189 RepID=A0A316VT22_9BASI|nr:Sec20-domain-containing protein [Ceraceosorus guamensis]PWN40737.1 Sec20-domain-containing protein [Ceraceosorus guamensis]